MGNICSSGSPSNLPPTSIKTITLNNVTLTLVHGDLALEEVDAVMISLDSNLHPIGPAAASIFKAGGKELIENVREKWSDGTSLQPGDIFLTPTCNLHSNHAIHVICPSSTSPEFVHKAFSAVLTEAGKQGFESISMSPLEISETSVTRNQQAEICFQVLTKFLRKKKLPQMSRIRLTSPEMPIMQAYGQEFDKHFPKWVQGRNMALKPRKESG